MPGAPTTICSPAFAGDPGSQYRSVAAMGLAIPAVVETSPPFAYNGPSETQDTPFASMNVLVAPQETKSGDHAVGATVEGRALEGTAEGAIVGMRVLGPVLGKLVDGDMVGFADGDLVGLIEGTAVGETLGRKDGVTVGVFVGNEEVGAIVGDEVGSFDGAVDGRAEGAIDGSVVGSRVGDNDG